MLCKQSRLKQAWLEQSAKDDKAGKENPSDRETENGMIHDDVDDW